MCSSRLLTWTFAVSAIISLIAVGCAYNSRPDSDRIKVEVANVGVDREGLPFVLLQDSSGRRLLPIMIGEGEAQAIALQLHGVSPGRPLTYDLIKNLLESTGNRVDRVEVSDLREQTYYATITLDHGRYQIDSRPSDAIAVALATNAPIYVASKLFEGSPAQGVGEMGPRAAHGLGLTVQEISQELASYFAVKPGSGLLVSDVSGQASRAGISRGDLLTRIDLKQVRTLKEFTDDLAQLGPQQQVTVTIEHNGRNQEIKLSASERSP